MLLPPEGSDVALTVSVDVLDGLEIWRRNFAGKAIRPLASSWYRC